RLGVQSSSRAASTTRARVGPETLLRPLNTKDTVACDVPARAATSLIVGIFAPSIGNCCGIASLIPGGWALAARRLGRAVSDNHAEVPSSNRFDEIPTGVLYGARIPGSDRSGAGWSVRAVAPVRVHASFGTWAE